MKLFKDEYHVYFLYTDLTEPLILVDTRILSSIIHELLQFPSSEKMSLSLLLSL